jgi:hypothetical protein
MQLDDYFKDALLVELSKQIIKSGTYFPADAFKERLAKATNPPIPDDILGLVVEQLVKNEFASEIVDEIGGSFVRLNYAPVNKFVSAQIAAGNNFVFRYSHVGQPLLASVVERMVGKPDGHEADLPTTIDLFESIPASDRIVRRNDNQEAIEEIKEVIADVRRIVHEDNEVGSDLGDDREIIDLELEIAGDVIQRPRFRLKSLLNWLLPALSFLAEKFATGAVGEAAKRLVTLLISLV